MVPDQAPEAVQEVALVDDHERVLEAPLVTDVGLALRDTVGAGDGAFTVTLTDLLVLPPAPLQLRLKVLLAVSVPVD